MTKFRVVFYPHSGERHSPFDILMSLDEKSRTSLQLHLENLERVDYEQWPATWAKKHTGNIDQLTKGNFRLMYVLDEPYLIILHIFRKHGTKTHPREIRRAISNYEAYLMEKGS